MLSRRVSGFVLPYQPMLLFIAALDGVISLWFTLAFCWHLWPSQGPWAIAAVGVLWECSKLHFGPLAVRGLGHGPWQRRIAHVPLGVLALVLNAGSVGASYGFTTLTHEAHRVDTAIHSEEHAQAARIRAEADADLMSRNQEIAALIALQEQLTASRHLTDAKATGVTITQKRQERDAAAQRIAALAAAPRASVQATQGDTLQTTTSKAIHLVVASMLELIGIAAGVLMSRRRQTQSTVQRPTSPTTPQPQRRHLAVVPGDAPSCSETDTFPAHLAALGDAFVGRYEKARELVLAGRIAPTVRAVQRAVHTSQEPARRILRALLDEGITVQVGRRYRLTATHQVAV